MVNFNDLSPEDQERILKQAREILDEENIKKDAITAYKIKRKDFVNKCLDEIYSHYNVRYETEKTAIKTRFSSIANYLFKANTIGIGKQQYSSSIPNVIITNAEEWNKFVKINIAVKELFLNCKEV